MQVVAHGHAVAHVETGRVLEHFDEGDEKVVAAVVELLDERVRVGSTFVTEDIEPLADNVTVEVTLLAQTFHDQLLHIAREQNEAVGVGDDHHIFAAFAFPQHVPCTCQQVGRVVGQGFIPGQLIHSLSPLEQAFEIDTRCGGWDVADNGGLAGTAADGFSHGPYLKPLMGVGVGIELASWHGYRSKMAGSFEACTCKCGFNSNQIVLGLTRTARFRNTDRQRTLKVKHLKRVEHACGVGIIGKIDLQSATALGSTQLIPVRSVYSVLQKLGAEGAATDTIDNHGIERFTRGSRNFTCPYRRKKRFNIGKQVTLGILYTVCKMCNPSAFIRILDLTGFDFQHFLVRRGHVFTQLSKVSRSKPALTQIEGKSI